MSIMSGAYLLIGEGLSLETQCQQYIKLLNKKSEKQCVIWGKPSKGLYRKIDFEPIRQALALQNDAAFPVFIIIQEAHKIPEQLAASLLKILEELPEYCYLFLLAPSQHLVLATLVSRCICINHHAPESAIDNPLMVALFSPDTLPEQFEEKVIAYISDDRTSALFAIIISAELLKKNHEKSAHTILRMSEKHLSVGNNKLFWRAIFALVHAALFRCPQSSI